MILHFTGACRWRVNPPIFFPRGRWCCSDFRKRLTISQNILLWSNQTQLLLPPLSILFYLSLLDLSLLQVYTQVRIPYNMEWGVDELLVGWTCIHSTLCCASFAIEHAVSLMVYITLHQYKESNLCYYTPFILIITFEPINSVKFPQYLLVSV